MASPTYESAIYKINSRQNVATRRCMRLCMTEYNCKLLPKELSFKDLTKILITPFYISNADYL